MTLFFVPRCSLTILFQLLDLGLVEVSPREGNGLSWTSKVDTIKFKCHLTKVSNFSQASLGQLASRYGRERIKGGLACALLSACHAFPLFHLHDLFFRWISRRKWLGEEYHRRFAEWKFKYSAIAIKVQLCQQFGKVVVEWKIHSNAN